MEKTKTSNYRLSKVIGVSQTTIANWKSGETEPREKARIVALNVFGVSEADIAGDNFPAILFPEKKKPTTQQGVELSKTKYDLLTPENKMAIDLLIERLLASQSPE